MYPFPTRDEILREPLAIGTRNLFVPNGPGLGVEIDERIIEKYPFVPARGRFSKLIRRRKLWR